MRQPILIVSPPRCGSSLMGMILKESGVFCGETKSGDKFNKFGYFENIEITNLVINGLKKIDNGLGKKFQPVNIDFYIPDFRKKVHEILTKEGLVGEQAWFYKDPKIALTWKLWHNAFPEAKWVILSRNENDVLDSYKRTEFMNAYQSQEEWLDYLNKFKQNIITLSRTVNCFEFKIENIFEKNETEIYNLFKYICVENIGKHEKCYDPKEIKK